MVGPQITQINTNYDLGQCDFLMYSVVFFFSKTGNINTWKILFLKKRHTKLLEFVWKFTGSLVLVFSEIIYKDAIEIEALVKTVQIEREKLYDVHYKGKKLRHKFYADFVMFDNIIVEIKACADGISDDHISQTLNYLKVSGCVVGLIINFGKKSLEHRRLVF